VYDLIYKQLLAFEPFRVRVAKYYRSSYVHALGDITVETINSEEIAKLPNANVLIQKYVLTCVNIHDWCKVFSNNAFNNPFNQAFKEYYQAYNRSERHHLLHKYTDEFALRSFWVHTLLKKVRAVHSDVPRLFHNEQVQDGMLHSGMVLAALVDMFGIDRQTDTTLTLECTMSYVGSMVCTNPTLFFVANLMNYMSIAPKQRFCNKKPSEIIDIHFNVNTFLKEVSKGANDNKATTFLHFLSKCLQKANLHASNCTPGLPPPDSSNIEVETLPEFRWRAAIKFFPYLEPIGIYNYLQRTSSDLNLYEQIPIKADKTKYLHKVLQLQTDTYLSAAHMEKIVQTVLGNVKYTPEFHLCFCMALANIDTFLETCKLLVYYRIEGYNSNVVQHFNQAPWFHTFQLHPLLRERYLPIVPWGLVLENVLGKQTWKL
jgi:hypothetical protein